jgi:hypothetical protein
MIQKHSEDPDVSAAAVKAGEIIKEILDSLAPAKHFDYGGHDMKLDDYHMCRDCTMPIAEAQQAARALAEKAETITDDTVKEHVQQAAALMRLEAESAEVRAELHNGRGSEAIVNELLGYIYHRDIHDKYGHSHADRGDT